MYNPNYYANNVAAQQPQVAQPDLNFYSAGPAATATATASNGPPFFTNVNGAMDNQYLNNPSFASGSKFTENSDSQLPKGLLAAFGTSGYPGEPSLLEELDINFLHIKVKTLAVLNPFGRSVNGFQNTNFNLLHDADLAGPICFVLWYGISLLLAGKIHFGYIYGCGLFGTLSLYLLFKLMSNNDTASSKASDPKKQDLDYLRTTSTLGYCLLPLVLLSTLGIVVTLDNFGGYLFSVLCTLWSTYSASGLFVLMLNLPSSRFLIAYPLLLFYSIFALMAIFVEKS